MGDAVEDLVESIEEKQEKFDECQHHEHGLEYDEEGQVWKCSNCGLHFESKKSDSSRLPDINEAGHYTEIVIQDYHPNWVRREAILKRMQQIFNEHADQEEMEEIYGESWHQLKSELKDMRTNTDLAKSGENE